MKKILMLLVLTMFMLLTTSCSKTDYVELEARGSFDFFWETQQTDKSQESFGLIPDRATPDGVPMSMASIASVGFGLAAFVGGVESGYITFEEGYERSKLTLEGMKKLKTVNGFYYHFYNLYSGAPSNNSEVSNIDSAILFCGALTAGEFFGEEVKELANEIYEAANWQWFINPATNQFYMSYQPKFTGSTDPSTGKMQGKWDVASEQLMLYFLGAGSPTYPIGKVVYDSFAKMKGSYGEYEFIYSWFGSIFTYQFSHAFIDFSKIIDANGIDWYQNSVDATLAAQKYCVDNTNIYKTFSKTRWGLTACDGPNGYSGFYGAPPSGGNNTAHKNDGTIACAGAIGSMPFAPKLVTASIEDYYTMLNGKLVGEFGLVDSFNLEGDTPWIARDYIGIDKGISFVMIENHRSSVVWDNFMKSPYIIKSIENLGFTYR